MLSLAAQLRLRLLVLVAVSFCLAAWTLWKGETMRAERDVRALLELNYRDVSRGFTDRADYQLVSIARDIAARFGSSGRLATEDAAKICAEEEVAEIYDVDANGVVVGGSRLVGSYMGAGAQSAEFLRLLEPDGPETLSQPDRPRTSDGKVFKYAAARFPDRSGYIEVGWSEERFLRFLRQRAYGYTRSWHIDERGFIVFVDRDGVVTSHADMSLAGKTLKEATGLDPATVPTGTLFRATIAGAPMFCYAGPVRDYLAVLADPVEDAFASRDRFMPRMAAVLLAVFALLFGCVSLMLRHRVAGSVQRIGEALRRIAGGDFGGRADVRSSREFSELSDNINATVAALRAASEDRVRRIEAELELGRTIQRAALPADFPSDDCFRLAASMEAAREVGGDFYDFFPLGETLRAFLVADVSGKGVTGALYMMNAKTLLKDALMADPAHDPAAALTHANAELCARNPAEMFVTAWVGVLDLETGRVAFANAGHNPPLRLREGAEPEWIRGKSGCPLGCFGGVSYKPLETALAPGDALFLYTDGVTEAMNPAGELFGEARLAATLSAAGSREPRALDVAVHAAVASFAADAPRADDITILALEYLAAPDRRLKTFPCDAAAPAASAAFLEETLDAGGCPPKDKARLLVALDEVVSNVVRCSGASGLAVAVRFAREPRGATVSVSDDGTPFDPLRVPPPDTTLAADDRPIGGLGMLLLRKTMDAVSYRYAHGCNILSFRKDFG